MAPPALSRSSASTAPPVTLTCSSSTPCGGPLRGGAVRRRTQAALVVPPQLAPVRRESCSAQASSTRSERCIPRARPRTSDLSNRYSLLSLVVRVRLLVCVLVCAGACRLTTAYCLVCIRLPFLFYVLRSRAGARSPDPRHACEGRAQHGRGCVQTNCALRRRSVRRCADACRRALCPPPRVARRCREAVPKPPRERRSFAEPRGGASAQVGVCVARDRGA